MPLIMKILQATQSSALSEPFTTSDITDWIRENKITKDDGKPYAASSIKAILSNSDIANNPTTNNNTKLLRSRLNSNKQKEYWFEN
jgi:hypothetical protein